MGFGDAYAISEVKEFQDPSNPGELNAKGKYFRRRDRMATGFVFLMAILIVLLVIAGFVYGPRLFGRKITTVKTPPPLPPRNRLSSSTGSSV